MANTELLKILEKNGSLKSSTFFNEFKGLIISLMKKNLSYKEIVAVLNEEAKKAGLKKRVDINQLVGFLNRAGISKKSIKNLKEYEDVKLSDDSKSEIVEEKKVKIFKNLVEK